MGSMERQILIQMAWHGVKTCLLRRDQVLLNKTKSTQNFPLPGTSMRTTEEKLVVLYYVNLTVCALSNIAEYPK